ncbi:coenzyme Q4 isoform X2 [Lycorma delicatula]
MIHFINNFGLINTNIMQVGRTATAFLNFCLVSRKQSNSTSTIISDVNTFYDDYKTNHIPTTRFQKMALTVASSFVSLLDPARGDMIAILGEASGESALHHMRNKMMTNQEGRKILQNKPRINSRTVDLSKLAKLSENTLGKTYHNFLVKNKVSPDSRLPVQFVDDVELAYVMQRYREAHDLIHALLYQPTNMLGEVTVKWVEAIQNRLPMCIGGALFGAMRLAPKQRVKYVEKNLPWAIKTGMNSEFLLNIYFEKRWEQSIQEIYNEFNITPIN